MTVEFTWPNAGGKTVMIDGQRVPCVTEVKHHIIKNPHADTSFETVEIVISGPEAYKVIIAQIPDLATSDRVLYDGDRIAIRTGKAMTVMGALKNKELISPACFEEAKGDWRDYAKIQQRDSDEFFTR